MSDEQVQADTKAQADLGKELAYKLKKAGMTMRRFREEHLSTDEWWQDGKAIRWHRHAIEKLMVYLEEPKMVSDFIDCRVIRRARNKRYAICGHFGEKIAVVVPRRLQKRIRRGMQIRVEVVTDAKGQRSYREQGLSS